MENSTAPATSDTMTLGDFMGQAPDPVVIGDPPTPKDTMSLDEFMGNPATHDRVTETVPPQSMGDFVLNMGLRLTGAINAGVSSLNNTVGFVTGLNNFDWYKKNLIDPGFVSNEKAVALTKPSNMGEQIAYNTATLAGNLSYTIPTDMMLGGFTKLALAGKVLPKVESILSKIPDFALGAGWRGMVQGIQKSEDIASGVVNGVVGGVEQTAIASLFGSLGEGWQSVAKMTTLGAAMPFYEASKTGRLPSKEELIDGATEGFILGSAFHVLPMLKEATQMNSEKKIFGQYYKEIQTHIENGNIEGVKQSLVDLQNNEKLRPEVREAMTTLTKSVLEPAEAKPPEPVKPGTDQDLLDHLADQQKDLVVGGMPSDESRDLVNKSPAGVRLFDHLTKKGMTIDKIEALAKKYDVEYTPTKEVKNGTVNTSEKEPGTGATTLGGSQEAQGSATEVNPTEESSSNNKGISSVAKSINQKAIDAGVVDKEGFKQLSDYDKTSHKQQAEIFSNVVNSSLEDARSMVRGEKELPTGGRGIALIAKMEQFVAENPDHPDTKEIRYELANSPHLKASSAAAQETELAKMRTPDSATKHLQDIARAKEEADGGKEKVSKERKSLTKKVKEDFEGVNLSKEELGWDKFLESIKC